MICIKSCSPLHFQLPKFRYVWRKKTKVIECQRGRLSALSHMENFIEILIKVWEVHFRWINWNDLSTLECAWGNLSCLDPEGGQGDPPEKSQKAILVRIPWKSRSYQISIQCWAIIGTLVKKKHCQSWNPSDKTFWISACLFNMHVTLSTEQFLFVLLLYVLSQQLRSWQDGQFT